MVILSNKKVILSIYIFAFLCYNGEKGGDLFEFQTSTFRFSHK